MKKKVKEEVKLENKKENKEDSGIGHIWAIKGDCRFSSGSRGS